jgi:hypothetical protein
MLKNCASANIVYSQTESVFIRKYYFTSKLFAVAREVFRNANGDKECGIKQQYTNW